MSIQSFPAGINSKATNQTYSILGHTVQVLMRSSQSKTGNFVFEQLTPPGLGVPPHTHSREDEVAIIIEGEFEVFVGGNVFQARAGDTLNFARGTIHGFKNSGTTMGRSIWNVTPGAGFESFFDEVKLFPPGPPDFVKLDALHKLNGIDMPPPV